MTGLIWRSRGRWFRPWPVDAMLGKAQGVQRGPAAPGSKCQSLQNPFIKEYTLNYIGVPFIKGLGAALGSKLLAFFVLRECGDCWYYAAVVANIIAIVITSIINKQHDEYTCQYYCHHRRCDHNYCRKHCCYR